MSFHLGAIKGEIAEKVLLPGDPLRAKYIAETFLEDSQCYSTVRGMYGFTGVYKGKRVSVQATGMGMPSAHIYIHELIKEYDCREFIRIGTFGSISEDVRCMDLMLAMGASTDSNINLKRFGGASYAPTADFGLLQRAYNLSGQLGLTPLVCGVMSQDLFYKDGDYYYDEDMERLKFFARFGIMGLDMETCELYTLAAKYEAKALAIMTCSDEVLTGKETTAGEREKSLTDMVVLALETI